MIDAEVNYADPLPAADGAPAMLAVTLGIGERGAEARDNFQVIVCNPRWIAQQVARRGGLWPRGMLVVETIAPDYVRAAAQMLVDQFRRSADWAQFAERLNRYLLWEYEDYNDSQGAPPLPPKA